MTVPLESKLMLIGVIVISCIAICSAQGTVDVNGACNADSNCIAGRGLFCRHFTGPSNNCTYNGLCSCPTDLTWHSSSNRCGCNGNRRLGDGCTTNSDCGGIGTTTGTVTCTGSRCTCPVGTYQATSFLCVEGPGNLARGALCTTQSQCGSNLYCTTCPGESGATFCFSGATTVQAKAVWILVISLIATTTTTTLFSQK